MTILGKKTKSKLVPIFNILGAVITGAIGISVLVLIIISLTTGDSTLNPTSYVLMSVFVLIMLLGCFSMILNVIKWSKLPQDLIKADEDNVYLYTDKETIIPIQDLDGAFVYATSPNVIVQFFTLDGYGTLKIDFKSKSISVPYLQEVKKIPPLLVGLVEYYKNKNK